MKVLVNFIRRIRLKRGGGFPSTSLILFGGRIGNRSYSMKNPCFLRLAGGLTAHYI